MSDYRLVLIHKETKLCIPLSKKYCGDNWWTTTPQTALLDIFFETISSLSDDYGYGCTDAKSFLLTDESDASWCYSQEIVKGFRTVEFLQINPEELK